MIRLRYASQCITRSHSRYQPKPKCSCEMDSYKKTRSPRQRWYIGLAFQGAMIRLLVPFLFVMVFILVAGEDPPEDDVIDLSHLGSRMYGQPDSAVGAHLTDLVKADNLSVNPEEVGSYIEGDILLPRPLGRNGILAESYRWPGGVVPFEIRGSFNSKEMSLIEAAMAAYHKDTCIKFTPRTGNDKDFISIQNGASGCWSSVGRVGDQQTVNLQSPGCVTKIGTVMHELMHALGFLHEQNREERDDHVSIQFNNVQRGTENNFEKAPKATTSGFGVPYDFGSIMHYSGNAFSINGQPTIVPKHKVKDTMGQREAFSSSDIQKIWKMYNCKATASAGGHKPNFASAIESIPNVFGEILNAIFPSGDEEEMHKS